MEGHHIFRSGDLSVEFENGNLRYLTIGNTEILQMVYCAVRDADWCTIATQVKNLQINRSKNAFSIKYQSVCQKGDIDFRWECSIIGNNNNITFDINGKAHTTFLANRIGFCVLHPIEKLAGNILQIIHSDGSESLGRFPVDISPHQPFKNISGIKWSLENATVLLELEGDVFEMEDQRNWLDASYKTYCTPLEKPYPVCICPGDRVHQTITIVVVSKLEDPGTLEATNYSLEISDLSYALPNLGLEATGKALNPWAKERLKQLPLSHLRVELRLDHPNGYKNFIIRTAEALGLDLPIELVIFTPSDSQVLEKYLSKIDWKSIRIKNILLIEIDSEVTSQRFIEGVLPVLRKMFGNLPIGGGTDYYFTHINRNRPPMELMDFCSFSANPQVHAFDDVSILETAQTFKYQIRSAQTFAKGRPIHISPITLKPRTNPDATRYISRKQLKTQRIDVRQKLPLTAQWTLTTIKNLIQACCAQATFFKTEVPRDYWT